MHKKLKSIISEKIDVSLIVTFHNERLLAHSTLNSIERCRQYAHDNGITTEFVWTLDCADEETKRIVYAHPAAKLNTTIIEVNFGDVGLSRNCAIEAAKGTAVAIFDGDDYYCKDWITKAWYQLQQHDNKTILHPEKVISFGTHNVLNDCNTNFNNEIEYLFHSNLWTSWIFTHTKTFLEIPYQYTNPERTGFGYEDWLWNCDTIAAGYNHKIAIETVCFYRRRGESLVSKTNKLNCTIPYSKLFTRQYIKGN